jgi:hypothetical protein
MKHSANLLAILAIVGFMCSPAFADLDNLDIGGDIKMLGVYAKNHNDFNDDARAEDDDQTPFVRTEAHLWVQAELAENVSARVSLEVDRSWSDVDGYIDMGYWNSTVVGDDLYIFLEEAYVKVADLYGVPVTITLGRQFIEVGDGFVLGDALPTSPEHIGVLGEHEQDPFDAIKIDYELTMDWLLTAVWTKVFESREEMEDMDIYMLNLGFYGLESHIIEAYYLLATVDGDGEAGYDDEDTRAKIHQVGVRGEGEIVEGLTYHAEATFQLADEIEEYSLAAGDYSSEDVGGMAGELGVKWAPPSLEANEVALGFTVTYMSGDDNPNDEDYDAYIQLVDNRVYGEIADFLEIVSDTPAGLVVFNADAEAAFTDRLKGALEVYYLMSDEDIGDEDDIGWEIDAYMNYQITEDLSAMLAAGFFDPGDATLIWTHGTADGPDDAAMFVRGGVSVSF